MSDGIEYSIVRVTAGRRRELFYPADLSKRV